ncbi:MAG: PDZ domain-containing protein [Thermincolia bacterium]
MEWLVIINKIISTIVEIIIDPQTFFWAIVLVVAFQYQRLAAQKARNFGLPRDPLVKPVLIATGYGILGGVLGSLLMLVVGISLAETGIEYLWPLAIMLMLINPRFLCFAYAGGIISLSYLFFGFPQVNVVQLMGLVAILHLVESLLILLSGHLGAVPVYFKTAGGRIVGGFTLQKFWPIPLVAIMVGYPWADTIVLPEGLPLLQSGLASINYGMVYSLMPVVAALGYGDLALTRSPVAKSRVSAIYLGLYSVTLLILAILASKWGFVAYMAALFAPLGHELIINMGRQMELKGQPCFIPPGQGIKILDVAAGTPAYQAGLDGGDIILTVNRQPVNDLMQLEESLYLGGFLVELEYIKAGGSGLHREVVKLTRGQPLGIIPVPEGREEIYMEIRDHGLLRRLWKRIKVSRIPQ